ncbi:quaternary amine ABC transporter ATP-binding protein [Haloglycomyces albus]|uniref:quaternary amine ABC transporter ATP-binding protein n=1 Tax=Haloglycomyces albus TaxID=526067 RepID=UPI00046D7E9D|nr:glycine betaine/L-proline ABC transporter ATP-binding protein [Haloglycomyces albus]
MSAITVESLYKVFGKGAKNAVKELSTGIHRDELQNRKVTAAVIDANFEVAPAEIFVVMGLSGSGKSTLIRMLNGLLKPTSGSVKIGDEEVNSLSASDLRATRREKVSMVFQHFALLPHRSVLDNVAFGLEIQGNSKEERYENARKAIEMVGLDGWEDKLPAQLSGGMRQRVGLARALASDTEILLMDEAFSALDPLIRQEMQDQLLDLQTSLGKTIVFITHDLNEAMKIGDRIAIMRDGRIIQIGTAEDILLHPANEYVSEFIADVDRSRVLTAETIMEPAASTDTGEFETVEAGTPVTELFETAASTTDPLLVVDDSEDAIGMITQQRILESLSPDDGDGPSSEKSDA